METWKNIEWFHDYQVSDKGRIKSFKREKPAILKQHLSGPKNGIKYRAVGLFKNGHLYPRKVHRLVALTFLGQRPPNFQISHINENRFDNRAVNLCYESSRDNNRRPISIMRKCLSLPIGESGYRGVKKPRNGKWEFEINHHGKRYYSRPYANIKDAAKAWDKKAIELRGKYAITNKKLGLL